MKHMTNAFWTGQDRAGEGVVVLLLVCFTVPQKHLCCVLFVVNPPPPPSPSSVVCAGTVLLMKQGWAQTSTAGPTEGSYDLALDAGSESRSYQASSAAFSKYASFSLDIHPITDPAHAPPRSLHPITDREGGAGDRALFRMH